MSNSEGPIRRRRIAGESKPAAPAKKAVAKKAVVKKDSAKRVVAEPGVARKAPVKKSPVKKSPVKALGARAVSVKQAAARKSSAAPLAKPPVPLKPAPTRAAAGAESVARDDRPTWQPPRRELRWLAPAALVAVAALVVGSWFAVTQISGRSNDKVATSNEQATAAAGAAAETIFSFTYDKLPEHLKASKALMTTSFAKQFDKIAPALTELAPQRKIQVQAVARNAGAVACGDNCSANRANILVFVDQARLVGNSKEPTVFGNRITVLMVKQHGSWLVSDIRAL